MRDTSGQPAARPEAPGRPSASEEERRLAERAQRDPTSDEARRALGELLGRYEGAVYSLCYRMVRDRDLARDLSQETLVKAIRSFESFDARSRLLGWILRIATNTCLTYFRRQKLRRHGSLDGSVDERSTVGSSIEQSREPRPGLGVEEGREARERVLNALASLDAEQRAVLLLRDAHGLEYTAIAESLGVAVGTVKSRLFRARAALREAFESRAAGTEW